MVEVWITLGVLAAVLAALLLEATSADVAFLGGLSVVVVAGVFPIEKALTGFANPTLLALGSLYVVAAAMRETGALARAANFVLGSAGSLRIALLRMIVPVSIGSAFMNNTPIVAMGIPAVRTWARQREISASKLLIPLSYAAIFGGMCTLMGTSTNLVAHGLLQSNGLRGFDFFELAWIGIPCTIAGWLYLVVAGPRLVQTRDPDSDEAAATAGARPPELIEIEIVDDANVGVRDLAESGFRDLPGLELRRIERDEESLGELGGDLELRPGDRLFYAPSPSDGSSLDIDDYPQLKLSVSEVADLDGVEEDEVGEPHSVVVRSGSRLAGKPLGDVRFRDRFNATVREIRRGGEAIAVDQVTEVKLRPGDTLILETAEGFRETFEDSPEFYVTSGYTEEEEDEAGRQTTRQAIETYAVLAVMLAIVGLTVFGVLDIAVSAALGAVALIGGRVISPAEARDAIDWQVLIVIGAALGLGEAMSSSGAAELIGKLIVDFGTSLGPIGLLAAVVIGTVILTEMITNNGAVALFFPIALSVAASEGLDPRPLIVGITAAGSMSLVTPFGYQTNLMVYSAGDYRFSDFPRAGAPLHLIFIVLVVALVPLIWPF